MVAAILGSSLPYSVGIDERGAAFAALGMAKVSGQPALLVCTSGSAVGHYLPAILEADESRVPLVVLSADRPLELQHSHAPQTLDQTQLFGSKVRAYMDLGAATASDRALRALRRKAAQMVAKSLGPVPGAVHLNFPASKPLEPLSPHTHAEHALEQRVSELLAQGVPKVHTAEWRASDAALDALVELATKARRPALSIGPCAPCEAEAVQSLYRVASNANWPVFAETTSQARFVGRGEPAASCRVEFFEHLYQLPNSEAPFPDFVLHVGAPLTSGNWHLSLDAHPETQLALASRTDWPDPEDRAVLMITTAIDALAHALQGRLPRAPAGFTQALLAASERVAACAERVACAPQLPFADPSVFRALDAVLVDGDQLVLGNSLPVRLADTWLHPDPKRPRSIRCVSQRGTNGIDGLISLAIGASIASGGRTVLVVGDISALHDLSALNLLAHTAANLTVLVINNQGGRIFEQLPIAHATPEQSEAHPPATPAAKAGSAIDAWTTPHDFELWRLGQVFGIPSRLADSEQSLQLALAQAHAEPGPAWIEARVAPDGARRWSLALRTEIALTCV